MKVVPYRIDGPFLKGDKVFFRCTSPAVGEVTRVANDQSWVDVKWYPGSSSKSGRYKPKDIAIVNGVLTQWIEQQRQAQMAQGRGDANGD